MTKEGFEGMTVDEFMASTPVSPIVRICPHCQKPITIDQRWTGLQDGDYHSECADLMAGAAFDAIGHRRGGHGQSEP